MMTFNLFLLTYWIVVAPEYLLEPFAGPLIIRICEQIKQIDKA